MAILDRPLFQRRPTRDELMAYGLPAFANGGIVYMQKGGDPKGLFSPKRQDEIEPETALTNLVPSMTTEQLQSGGRLPEVAVTEETTTTTEETTPEETTTTTEEETTTTNEEMAPQTSGDRELFDKV